MKALEYRAIDKPGSTLQGFADFGLESGMVVRDVALHQRDNGAKWLSMPARRYEVDGEVRYYKFVDFKDSATRSRFQKQALEALDEYVSANHNRDAKFDQNNDTDTKSDAGKMSDEEIEASERRCAEAAAQVKQSARSFDRWRRAGTAEDKRS